MFMLPRPWLYQGHETQTAAVAAGELGQFVQSVPLTGGGTQENVASLSPFTGGMLADALCDS